MACHPDNPENSLRGSAQPHLHPHPHLHLHLPPQRHGVRQPLARTEPSLQPEAPFRFRPRCRLRWTIAGTRLSSQWGISLLHGTDGGAFNPLSHPSMPGQLVERTHHHGALRCAVGPHSEACRSQGQPMTKYVPGSPGSKHPVPSRLLKEMTVDLGSGRQVCTSAMPSRTSGNSWPLSSARMGDHSLTSPPAWVPRQLD